jgi:hypothetical protein
MIFFKMVQEFLFSPKEDEGLSLTQLMRTRVVRSSKVSFKGVIVLVKDVLEPGTLTNMALDMVCLKMGQKLFITVKILLTEMTVRVTRDDTSLLVLISFLHVLSPLISLEDLLLIQKEFPMIETKFTEISPMNIF